MKTTVYFNKLLSLAVCLALALSFLPLQQAQAVSPNIVISQVYAAGGNSGATYKNDYVEVFNRGGSDASLNGWSLQYASASGTGTFSGGVVTLPNAIVLSGQYYLVQLASGGANGVVLPVTADYSSTVINLAATAGKIALVNTTTGLACNGGSTPCSPAQLAQIIDLVGFGTANFYEGSGPAPAPSLTNAIFRANGGCTDTDNNSTDFGPAAAPAPRNTASPFHYCTGPTTPSGFGAANPSNLFVGDTTLLTVAVTPGANPPSTGLGVTCDLSAIGGGSTSQTFYDDGTHGDAIAGNNTFSYSTTIAGGTTAGVKSLACTVGDAQLRNGSAPIGLTVLVILPIGTVNGAVGNTDDGTLHRSPFAPPTGNGTGQIVTVQGVIYEKTLQAISGSTNAYYGFFIQNTNATADTDPNTSDGLFVFMNTSSTMSGPGGPYTPKVGDEIVVSGGIQEYYNMTELVGPSLVKPVVRSGVDLEAELPPFVANPPANLADANRYWERQQGMRGQVPANSIVTGGRNVFSPADAEIWLVNPGYALITGRANPYARRSFRDAHPLDDNYDPANWDGNGYRILMGSLGIKGTTGDAQALLAPARTFDTVTNAPVGGVNYSFSKYRIEVTAQPTLNEGVDPAANNPPGIFDPSIHYSIADYNLENLYDFRDNPFSGCDFVGGANTGCPARPFDLGGVTPPYDYVPASDAAYQARLNDISLQIINDLHSPDILMVQEVENQDICTVNAGVFTCGVIDNADGKPDVLQELALKIAANGGPAYDAAFDRDSSDLRGIAPAFLYRTDRVQLVAPSATDPVLGNNPVIGTYASVPYDSDVSNPKTLNAVSAVDTTGCETTRVFPRAPDIGLFRIYSTSIGVGSHRDVYVVNNHFKSSPDACVGPRTEQAKYNAAIVQAIQAANPDARIVLGGDLNVYPRPDDPFAPIGKPGSSDQLGSLYDPGLGLTNLWDVLLGQAPESAYSYVYLGMAQTLDQMFVSQSMLANLQQFRIAHINSDFPADYPGDVARGTSDHDPNVANFVINDPPSVKAGGPYAVNEGSSVTLTATGTDPEGQPLTYAWDLDNNGTFETPGQSVSFKGVDGPATKTVNVQVTDNGGLTATASAAVIVNNVAPTVGTPAVSPEPSTEGSSVTASATFADPAGSYDVPYTCTVNYGDGSGNLSGVVSGATCTGPAHSYATFGLQYTVTISVTDKDGGVGTNSAPHSVIFNWTGFFQPIDNLPALNAAKAGSAIPVKFALGGNKGLNILAAGSPSSAQINCASGAVQGGWTATGTAGSSGLQYDSGQYSYVWKTDKSWGGTCRQLKVTLSDGTVHSANFTFK